MNLKESAKVKTGSFVREAWGTKEDSLGIILHKEYVEEEHFAKCLGGKKQKRWDIWVHWLHASSYRLQNNPGKLQCWEIMLVNDD